MLGERGHARIHTGVEHIHTKWLQSVETIFRFKLLKHLLMILKKDLKIHHIITFHYLHLGDSSSFLSREKELEYVCSMLFLQQSYFFAR